MESNPLKKLMNPGSIAFFGASNSIMTIGTPFLLNIIKGGYRGKVFPVHPREKTVLGLRAFKDVDSLPEVPDLVYLVIPKKAVLETMESCGKKGVKRAIVVSAGYGETGTDEGKDFQKAMDSIAAKYGIRYLGPNCMGVINTETGLNTTWFPYTHAPGHISFISQSGSYVTQSLPYFARMGVCLSKAISIGNQANIDMVDCLEYLGEDPSTRVIAMYVEEIKRPRDFLEAAKEISPEKPIVALYVGGTRAGARATATHTSAMSGKDELYTGLFRQAGVLRTCSFPDLFDSALALAEQPLPAGNRMAILTNSGGPAITMADACERMGLRVDPFDPYLQDNIRSIIPPAASPNNPVDVTLNYDPDLIFSRLPEMILDSPHVDGMLFYGIFGPVHLWEKIRLAGDLVDIPIDMITHAMQKACKRLIAMTERFRKPILCVCFCNREDDEIVAQIEDGGIPVYPTPERAVKAMAALYRYANIKTKMGT